MLYILTLHWNARDKIIRLYNSLLPALEGIRYKWVIKDNGSMDGSYDKIAALNNPNIDCIKYPHNKDNFAQGMNYLFDYSKANDTDQILLLNNDVIFNDSTSIHKMIALLKDDVGMVGAKLLYPGTRKIQHAGVIFTINSKTPCHYRRGEVDDEHSSKNRYFQACTAAVLLCQAKDYRQTRMNEKYIYAFEDIDLCFQMKFKLEKKIIYCGKTEISHEESASLKLNPIHKLHMQHNVSTFINTWKGYWKVDLPLYISDPNYNLIK